MEIFFFWVLFSIVVGIIANARGRMGFGWFMLSLIFTPLLMGILVLALGNPKLEAEQRALLPNPETHIKCPDCRELVLREARKCKHCGAALIPQVSAVD